MAGWNGVQPHPSDFWKWCCRNVPEIGPLVCIWSVQYTGVCRPYRWCSIQGYCFYSLLWFWQSTLCVTVLIICPEVFIRGQWHHFEVVHGELCATGVVWIGLGLAGYCTFARTSSSLRLVLRLWQKMILFFWSYRYLVSLDRVRKDQFFLMTGFKPGKSGWYVEMTKRLSQRVGVVE